MSPDGKNDSLRSSTRLACAVFAVPGSGARGSPRFSDLPCACRLWLVAISQPPGLVIVLGIVVRLCSQRPSEGHRPFAAALSALLADGLHEGLLLEEELDFGACV